MTILLCTIGAATITTWLFRLIDAIDRSCETHRGSFGQKSVK